MQIIFLNFEFLNLNSIYSRKFAIQPHAIYTFTNIYVILKL